MMIMAPLMMTPREMYWWVIRILVGLYRIRMLPARLTRPIWMR